MGRARELPDRKSAWDREDEFGNLINDFQSGRTHLGFAFNRIMGQYWSSVERVSAPPPPVRGQLRLKEPTRESLCQVMSELANVFLRHKGQALAIFEVPVDEWLHFAVFEDGLVSGSDAMRRELKRLFTELDWGGSPEDGASKPEPQ
jgi:hypothetical protein